MQVSGAFRGIKEWAYDRPRGPPSKTIVVCVVYRLICGVVGVDAV